MSGSGRETSSTPWLLLVLLTALAVALRVIGLDGGLWYDEIRTLLLSVRSPLSTIVTVLPGNNQHTFYSVLAHLSTQVFGEHPWSLRLPAMILGAATVPMLYLFAREFVGRAEALLAGLLLAVAYHHVWFSQNARGYTALTFLTLLSCWLLLRGLRRGKAGDFVAYGVAAALGVYTHLTMVFLVVSHLILCLIPLDPALFDRKRPGWWRLPAMGFALAGLFTLLLYAPILLDVRQIFVDRPSPMQVATPKWAVMELLRGLNIGLGTGAGALVGATLVVVGLWSYYRQSRFLLGMFLLPGVITVAAALAARRPIFPRFLFFLVGFALLIVVRGALEIGRWISRGRSPEPGRAPTVGIALVAVLAIASVATLIPNYRYPKQDFEGAMQFVERQRVEGEPIVTVGSARYIYREYYHRPWESAASLEELRSIRARGRRVWVLYTLKGYIRNTTPDLMEALDEECAVAGTFRGSLRDGDVTVCAMPPRTALVGR